MCYVQDTVIRRHHPKLFNKPPGSSRWVNNDLKTGFVVEEVKNSFLSVVNVTWIRTSVTSVKFSIPRLLPSEIKFIIEKMVNRPTVTCPTNRKDSEGPNCPNYCPDTPSISFITYSSRIVSRAVSTGKYSLPLITLISLTYLYLGLPYVTELIIDVVVFTIFSMSITSVLFT